MTPCVAVILAGGRSRRMNGVAKGTLSLAGRPVLSHVIHRLAPQAGKLFLNTNHGEVYLDFGLPVIADRRPDFAGPLAGVEAALLALEEEWLLTVAVDTPFLPKHLLASLLAKADDRPVTVASRGRCHPVICLWPRSVLAEIRKALDQHHLKLVQWFDEHPHQVVSFADLGGGVDPFFNVNQPSHLAEAEDLFRQLGND